MRALGWDRGPADDAVLKEAASQREGHVMPRLMFHETQPFRIAKDQAEVERLREQGWTDRPILKSPPHTLEHRVAILEAAVADLRRKHESVPHPKKVRIPILGG